jgi:seryl-tRNA synthetase
MANSKDIELAIKAKDLASKPLQEIGAAVDALVSAVAEIAPASEKGAKNFQELNTTANQLQKAMQGLKADASLVETFTALSSKVEAASKNLKTLREQADAAKIAISNTAEPTKAAETSETATKKAIRQAKIQSGFNRVWRCVALERVGGLVS